MKDILDYGFCMKVDDLGKNISKDIIGSTHFRGRELITISKENFEKYCNHFTQGVKIGEKINYRSKHYRKHIHAIQDGDSLQIHIDHGNPYLHILLTIPHVIIDVIPYFLRHILTRKKPYTF